MTFLARMAGGTFFGVASLFALPPAPAEATTWRLSSMMTPDSFEGLAYQRFADLVAEYTDGEIEIRIYPNEQVGSMEAVVEQLSQGVIQLAPSAISFMSRWEDGVQFASAPFLFDDYDHWARFINGPLVQGWLDSVAEQSNITVLGSIPDMPRGTFRTLLSRTPVPDVAALSGLKLRQFQNSLIIDAWTHLGTEVRVLPWGEVYDGISRGIVDAVTSPAESIESMRFYEVAPHIIRTDEYPQAVAWMMNRDAWNALTPEQQDALTRAHQEASAYARELLAESAATLEASLEAREGVTVDFDFDTAALVAQMAEFYASEEAAGRLPEGLLEAVEAARSE